MSQHQSGRRSTVHPAAIVLLMAGAMAGNAFAGPPGLTSNRGSVAGEVLLPAPKVPAAKSMAGSDRSKPRQFAIAIPTDITPATAGNWQQLPDGRSLWRIRIASRNAKSLNLAFGHLRLPRHAELYVYNDSGDVIHGPYRASDLRRPELWTPIVEGEAALVEVVLPAAQRDELELQITQVNHGIETLSSPLIGESSSCQVDVACPAGDAWSIEARSVAVYTFGGQYSCTGTLVNNTAQDQTPYFLTAHHCVRTAEEAASTVFYWNYQASSCGAKDGNRVQSQSGADLVALSEVHIRDGGSDFSLLKLWQKPDASFNVYYAGWDRRDYAPDNGVAGIHHPRGDEKKISTSDRPTYIASIRRERADTVGPEKLTHLFVQQWNEGILELGSSGSALWNADRRVVGHASIGGGTCDSTETSAGYGRLYYDWSASSDPRYSIAPHLDPIDSDVEVLDGLDPSVPPAPDPGTEPVIPDQSLSTAPQVSVGGLSPFQLTMMALTWVFSGLWRRRGSI